MAGYLLNQATAVECSHGAQATLQTSNDKVTINGQPVAVLSDACTVSGCSFQVPIVVGTKPQPCTQIRWIQAAEKVRVMGQPVLLQRSQGTCLSAEQIPQGVPKVSQTQSQVRGE